MPVILINTSKQNISLWQPLLAAELFTVEYNQVEHRASMERKGGNVDISFLPVVPDTIRVQLEEVEATSTDTSPPSSINKTTFGPGPNTQATDFDFSGDFSLPFLTILQSWFIDIIYDHPEVFSLHDEDLRFCDQIRHTILTTMDRPVYLSHCTIPLQVQVEVHKC